jgi:hypothetical protein
MISEKKSGYFATNMPQTGHLSFGVGWMGFISPADTKEARRTNIDRLQISAFMSMLHDISNKI